SLSIKEPVDFAGLPVGSSWSCSRIVRTTVSYAGPNERRYSSRDIRSASVGEPFLNRSPRRSICVLLSCNAPHFCRQSILNTIGTLFIENQGNLNNVNNVGR